jgi:hypothetical protein
MIMAKVERARPDGEVVFSSNRFADNGGYSGVQPQELSLHPSSKAADAQEAIEAAKAKRQAGFNLGVEGLASAEDHRSHTRWALTVSELLPTMRGLRHGFELQAETGRRASCGPAGVGGSFPTENTDVVAGMQIAGSVILSGGGRDRPVGAAAALAASPCFRSLVQEVRATDAAEVNLRRRRGEPPDDVEEFDVEAVEQNQKPRLAEETEEGVAARLLEVLRDNPAVADAVNAGADYDLADEASQRDMMDRMRRAASCALFHLEPRWFGLRHAPSAGLLQAIFEGTDQLAAEYEASTGRPLGPIPDDID